MKQFVFFLAISLVSPLASGQNYGNVWHFGNVIGLDFTNCDPVVVNGANPGVEGCSSIAGPDGELLFYTNSEYVWNKQHLIMTNGYLNSTNQSLSQVIIIPKPLSSNLYYVVTTRLQASGSLTMQYHTVDMALNGGSGDVLNKNNVLSTLNTTEQICATYHGNGTDIWLMAHEYGTSNFLAYLVTSDGISETPVVSSVGPAHAPCNANINARGEIKFSPDGNKLAMNANGIGTNDATNLLTVCNFNKNTGQVSNPINLPFSRGEFGLSFSPDNSKLYGATWKAFQFTMQDYNYLYQFDLSSGVPSTIINSKVIIDSVIAYPTSHYGTLKIGPNGKIYVRYVNSSYLGVINSPNQAGVSCNYDKNGLNLGGQQNYQYGLNNYIEYTNYCDVAGLSTRGEFLNSITVFPNPVTTSATLQTDPDLHDATLRITNCFGQEVMKMTGMNGKTITLDRGNLPSGIYFIHLIQDNLVIASEKISIAD